MRDAIRNARETARMTQAMLAIAADVSRRTVQRAEAGMPVSHESMRAICAVLSLESSVAPERPVTPPDDVGTRRRSGLPLTALACLPYASLRILDGWHRGALLYAHAPLVSDDGLDLLRRVGALSCALGLLCVVSFCALAFDVVRRGSGPYVRRAWPGAALALVLFPAFLFAEGIPGLPEPASLWERSVLAPSGRIAPVPAWEVVPSSSFGRAGLRLGDVIRTVDGTPVDEIGTFVMRVLPRAGGRVEVGVDRVEGKATRRVALVLDVESRRTAGAATMGYVTGYAGMFARSDHWAPGWAIADFAAKASSFARTAVGLNGRDAVLVVDGRTHAYADAPDWAAWMTMTERWWRAEIYELCCALALAVAAAARRAWRRPGPRRDDRLARPVAA